ncbi:response regulator [uncultured Sphaerochaeta sp.]|uniref:response regulator transcription factor n=1 Tax=uncultured Sphaerochaeta sp. TaxID=886478 RepID=UPI002A0A9316|nr:response regulator [uncultured Sphaerochaeta sp.]
MIRLMFVDDDSISQRAIRKSLDWKQLGIELSYVACDGIDALEYLQSNTVDLILSDVMMPVLNGIEMAKEIHAIYSDILFIFISGYQDFIFAQQALKLNAFDYLTKPISKEDLSKTLLAACKQLNVRKQEKLIKEIGLTLAKRNYLSELLAKDATKPTREELERYKIDLTEGFGAIGIIKMAMETKLSTYGHTQLCDFLEQKIPHSIFVQQSYLELLFLYYTKAITSEISYETAMTEVKQSIKKLLLEKGIQEVDFNIGTPFADGNGLTNSYFSAVKSRTDSNAKLIEMVKEYYYLHYQEKNLNLKSIAKEFAINPCYLTVVFKKETNISAYSFLIKLRLNKAKELLSTTDMRIYEIADAVGYSSNQYLSFSFKEQFGITISDYKKSLENPHAPWAESNTSSGVPL